MNNSYPYKESSSRIKGLFHLWAVTVNESIIYYDKYHYYQRENVRMAPQNYFVITEVLDL